MEFIIFPTPLLYWIARLASSFEKYPNIIQISICVSNSFKDPLAILKNLEYSPGEFRPYPSAIFEGIDTAALRI